MVGPLSGIRVVELGALGPVPHAVMVLADLGADAVRVARPLATVEHAFSDVQDATLRGRRQVRLDLKDETDRQAVLDLARRADVLVEGFRPGVAERLGVGPTDCHAVNPDLVYARMTGWGQTGPWAQAAGHDLNYLSVTGALHAMGRQDGAPPVPLNLVGDYGGGSMFLVAGILAALVGRRAGSEPVVLDVAMVDGISALQQPILSMRQSGTWTDERSSNLIDGGAPFYDTYRCADGRFVAVGALEPPFFDNLLTGLGLTSGEVGDQLDREGWPRMRAALEVAFASRTRDAWAEAFDGVDACVTPVLDFAEAAAHPHLSARRTVVAEGSATAANPAPRFGTDGPLPRPQPAADVELESVLADWGPRP